jgi:hypothetical protein
MEEQISEWRAQLRGALDRRRGLPLGVCLPANVSEAAQVRYVHGWARMHQACDCRYSLERGRSA